MLYISGPNDIPEQLFEHSEYGNPRMTYLKLNPELNALYPAARFIPEYMPVCLDQHSDPAVRAEMVKKFLELPQAERKALRDMQESNCDIITQMAMADLMAELQQYAKGFRQWLKAPLVTTPWTEFNKSLTDKSLFKMVGETIRQGSNMVQNSPRFMAIDKLYEDMMARDVLNRQLHMLRQQRGSELLGTRRELERQIKELTARIKQQIPKKLEMLKQKYVSNGYSVAELNKMRSNSTSAKAARNGKLATNKLDFLNRTGLARLQQWVKNLKTIGGGLGLVTKGINYAVVAFDTVEAYNTSGGRDAMKTFITSVGALYITTQAAAAVGGTAALGGIVLGSVVGDLAIGATILVSSPILGWIALCVVGVAVTGYVAYKAKGVLEEAWDFTEEAVGWLYNVVKDSIVWTEKEIVKVMQHNPRWVLDLYDSDY